MPILKKPFFLRQALLSWSVELRTFNQTWPLSPSLPCAFSHLREDNAQKDPPWTQLQLHCKMSPRCDCRCQINTRDVIGRLGMTLWKRALKDLSPLCLWSTNSNYCGSQQTICPGIRKCSKHQTVFFQTINFPTVFFQSIFLRSVPGLRTGWFFGVHCQK